MTDDISALADAMSRHNLLAYYQERAAAVLADLEADGWRLVPESECERLLERNDMDGKVIEIRSEVPEMPVGLSAAKQIEWRNAHGL